MHLSLKFRDICFSKERAPNKKEGWFFLILSHYIIICQTEWRESRLTLAPLMPQTLCTLIDPKGESDPTGDQLSSPAYPLLPGRAAGMCPSGQAALFSGLFLPATCKAWTHCQPWRTFLRGPESDGVAFPAVGNNGFSPAPWPSAGERLSYRNTCPSTSRECHWYEVASRMQKSFEKFKNISQDDKRTKHVMIAMTSEHSSAGQSGLSMTSQVLFKPQDFHPSF